MGQIARDLMQTHLITVSPDTPLANVQRLFVEEEINGAPVVDEAGKLLGVISATDLMRAVDEGRERGGAEAYYFRDDLDLSGPDWANLGDDFHARLAERTVTDAMTRGGVTVSPEATVAEVAGTLRRHRIHRVLICEGETPVGIISTFDLVALLEKEPTAR